jgi:hypothetical protein
LGNRAPGQGSAGVLVCHRATSAARLDSLAKAPFPNPGSCSSATCPPPVPLSSSSSSIRTNADDDELEGRDGAEGGSDSDSPIMDSKDTSPCPATRSSLFGRAHACARATAQSMATASCACFALTSLMPAFWDLQRLARAAVSCAHATGSWEISSKAFLMAVWALGRGS